MRETTLDEICQAVGYSATRVIAHWYAGQRLHVPQAPAADHPLATLIGVRPLRALAAAVGGGYVSVPTQAEDQRYARERTIALRLAEGMPLEAIARELDVTVRWVQLTRKELVLRGWLDYARGRMPKRGRPGSAPQARPEILRTGEPADEPPGG